jgi:hypothetical protein
MKSKSGRVIVACCVLAAVIGLLIYTFIVKGAGAAAQALPDTGKFKVGSALGEERGGFSGRPKLQVFVTADSPEWPSLSACLQSAEVEAEMVAFTGVLIDAAAEPGVESFHRQRDGFQVLVRGMNGAFWGGLKSGFACSDLVDLLKEVRFLLAQTGEIERSPIYASLMDSPAAVDFLVKNGQESKAARFVELLREFEGANSPSVAAAEAMLNQ